MSKRISSAEEALQALKDALQESETWESSSSDDNWDEIPTDEWDEIYPDERAHDLPEDFYDSHYDDYDNPYDDYEEVIFTKKSEPKPEPKQKLYRYSDQSDWDVHEDGDFNFIEPKHQKPQHENDHINRRGRLYNEHMPRDIIMIMHLFNVANQRYVNDYLIHGIQELVVSTIDDDPYQAGFIMYSFAILLTTSKEDEVRSHLFAAIEMLWDAYTNACYGYKFKKYGSDTFLSAMEYNMFQTTLNYLNFLHNYLYPLEKESGRFNNSPYAVSKFTHKFLNRDDVKVHMFRIQPDFENKMPPQNHNRNKRHQSGGKNRNQNNSRSNRKKKKRRKNQRNDHSNKERYHKSS